MYSIINLCKESFAFLGSLEMGALSDCCLKQRKEGIFVENLI